MLVSHGMTFPAILVLDGPLAEHIELVVPQSAFLILSHRGGPWAIRGLA